MPSGLVRVLGVVVREEREWQAYSRAELAALARVDAGMIYRLECGKVGDVGLDFAMRLADALGYRLPDLLIVAGDRMLVEEREASGGPR